MKLTNTKELIQWFEENFNCLEGPYRGYFELPSGPFTTIRYVYTTFAVATKADETAEARLVTAFKEAFYPILLHINYPTLIWRLTTKIEFDLSEEQQLGQLLVTREEIQDGKVPPPGSIQDGKVPPPGSIQDGKVPPPGSIQDFETGNWFENKGLIIFARVYTRLCIPELIWKPYDIQFSKPEGQKMELI